MLIKKITISLFFIAIGLHTFSQWQLLGPAGFSASNASFQSIATNSLDSVYVAYQDGANNNRTSVMKFDGTNWLQVGPAGFSSTNSASQSLAIDANDSIYVAFQDPSAGNKVSVMKFDGTNWSFVGPQGISAGSTDYVSLKIDHTNGFPTVAYQDNANGGRTTVMAYNGTSWVTIGTAGFSAGGALYQSLAIDVNGIPHVAYSDVLNGARTTVMRFNGTFWENVGSPGFSDGLAIYQSLAISKEDSLFVAYRDAANGDKTTVMKFGGSSSWVPVQNVGISTNAASYQSLIMDHGDRPVVAYRDGNAGAPASVRRHFFGWGDVGIPSFTSGGADYTSLTGTSCGDYFMAFSDGANGDKTSVMWFKGNQPPQLIAPSFADTSICENESFGAMQVTMLDYDSCNTYTLTVTSSDQVIIPNGNIDILGGFPSYALTITPATGQSGGPVTITVTADDGEFTTDTTFTITVNPIYIMQETESICEGDSILLGGEFQTTSGLYKDSLVTVHGCDSVIETTLTVNPAFNETVSLSICEGESVFLEGADQTQSGVYTDSLVNPNTGCDSIIKTFLSVEPIPTVDAGPDKTTDQFTPVGIEGSSSAFIFSWSPTTGLDNPNSLTPNAQVETTTTYILTGVDGSGCSISDTMTVTVEEVTGFIVNTMLTPNGDGKNDTWNVDHPDLLEECSVTVMNRWGTKVFARRGYANEWDGTKAGQKLPDGTYYYIIDCQGNTQKGVITLLR